MSIYPHDIVFKCPLCSGPIIARQSEIGMRADCPHCHGEIEMPDLPAVEKKDYHEPRKLRRILTQIRDQEWEKVRREVAKLREREALLTARLTQYEAAIKAGGKISGISEAEVHKLKKQVAQLTERAALANQAFIAGRRQYDSIIEKMRADLEASRQETQRLRMENEIATVQVRALVAELEQARRSSPTPITTQNGGKRHGKTRSKRQGLARAA